MAPSLTIAQRLADALANGDWNAARQLDADKASSPDASFDAGYGQLDRASLMLLDAKPEGAGHRHFIDLLWGSDRLRRAVDADDDPLKLCDPPAPPARWAGEDALLYT